MSTRSPNPPNNMRCAPSKIKNRNDGTCYDLEALQKMVKAYNKFCVKFPKKYSKGEIKYDDDQFKNKKYLLKELNDKLSKVCDDQLCWIKLDFIEALRDGEIQYNTFRPEGPSSGDKKFQWLSNIDIDRVMFQYENHYKDFKYLETVPIDFQILSHLDIAKIDFNKLLKDGHNKIGVVFNLDEHTQSGSHWVALFSDLKNKQIYFFDSYGIKPEKRIKEFMAKIANYLGNTKIYNDKNVLYDRFQHGGSDLDIRYNKIRTQFGGSECGVYSISFILRLLKGDTFDTITKARVPDKKINQCRKFYFTQK